MIVIPNKSTMKYEITMTSFMCVKGAELCTHGRSIMTSEPSEKQTLNSSFCCYNQHFSSTITIKLSNNDATRHVFPSKFQCEKRKHRDAILNMCNFFFLKILFYLKNRAYNIKHANK